MKIYRNIYLFCLVFLAGCAQAPTQQTDYVVPEKVSSDYEAIGDASGIRPYVYGKHTLIKFDGGTPSSMSIKDKKGASVGYKVQGSYYLVDRKLDMFTLSEKSRTVQFNLIQPEPEVEIEQDIDNEEKFGKLTLAEDAGATEIVHKIQTSDPIYKIMYEQLLYQRKLFNIASENPKFTGEELYQINTKLDAIEYKVSQQEQAIVHVYFPFNNTEFKPEQDLVKALLPLAKDATKINIFGRTDAITADKGNSYVAKERANAAKDFLVTHGVSADIIRTSSLASGDFIAPAEMEEGRKLNRRVTIQVISD